MPTPNRPPEPPGHSGEAPGRSGEASGRSEQYLRSNIDNRPEGMRGRPPQAPLTPVHTDLDAAYTLVKLSRFPEGLTFRQLGTGDRMTMIRLVNLGYINRDNATGMYSLSPEGKQTIQHLKAHSDVFRAVYQQQHPEHPLPPKER